MPLLFIILQNLFQLESSFEEEGLGGFCEVRKGVLCGVWETRVVDGYSSHGVDEGEDVKNVRNM